MQKTGIGAVVVVVLLMAAFTGTSNAAVCADYPNQAAAQEAADTRDADGDGIYCESLPCPCATGGGGSGGGGGGSTPPPKPSPPPKRTQTIAASVLKVVDGDTIDVKAHGAARSRYRVRLIGIDTPERYGGMECGAREATVYMQRIAWKGRRVTLRTDPTQDTFDRYGRLLAYVDVKSGSFQAKMIVAGWAKVYVYGGKPFERVAGYRGSERRAKRLRRGVWGQCGGNFHRRVRASAAATLHQRNLAADSEARREANRTAELQLKLEKVQGSAAASTAMCRNVFGGDMPRVTNMHCHKARSIIRTWAIRYKRDGAYNRTVNGFRCRIAPVKVEGAIGRCTNGNKNVRFYPNVP